jgi:hypothetical protein
VNARGRSDADVTSGDAHETEHVESLLKACDEVLEYHERDGSSDAPAAKQVRAKRAELRERLPRSSPG